MKFNYHLITNHSFLDISKSFGEAWHQGLSFKSKPYEVEANLFKHFENYLDDWKQRVILDGYCLSLKIILSDVPKDSVLGPLLFLIYINDLMHGLISICIIFADDMSTFSKVFDKDVSKRSQ